MTRSTQSHSHGRTPITHRATALGASPNSNPAPSADLLEKPSAEPKLSVKRPGHWRNKWRLDRATLWSDGEQDEPGEVLCSRRWPSREIAEQKGREAWAIAVYEDPKVANFLTYLGPVFFPEGADPPS